MMTSKTVFKAEEFLCDMERISSMQMALFDAIFNGPNAVETFEWAFCALMELTLQTKDELRKSVDSAFEELKKE